MQQQHDDSKFVLRNFLANMIHVGDPANGKVWDLVMQAVANLPKSNEKGSCSRIVGKLLRNYISDSEHPLCFPGSKVLKIFPESENAHGQAFAFKIEGLYMSTNENVVEKMKNAEDVRIWPGLYGESAKNHVMSGFRHSNDPFLLISWYYTENNYECHGPLRDAFRYMVSITRDAMKEKPRLCLMLGRRSDPENPFAAIVVNVMPKLFECRMDTRFFLRLGRVDDLKFMARLMVFRDHDHYATELEKNGLSVGNRGYYLTELEKNERERKEDAMCLQLLLDQGLPRDCTESPAFNLVLSALRDDKLLNAYRYEFIHEEVLIKPIAIPSSTHYNGLPFVLRNGKYPRKCKDFVVAIFNSRIGQVLPQEIIVHFILSDNLVLWKFNKEHGTYHMPH